MRISGLRCTDCGGDDVIAIWPGRAGEQGDMFWLIPNRPVRAWCEFCWLKKFGPKPRLPRRGSKQENRAVA